MNKKLLVAFLFSLSLPVFCRAQNLPSLILNRNINSTFCIVGYDPNAKEWGIAVATNNIYVGNSTCYVQLGIGAFATIAETEPAYASNGFEQLKQGKTIKDAILFTKQTDADSDTRQVAGIDSAGNVYAFTGSSLRYWKGTSTDFMGKYYAVMGNQLSPNTLKDMAATFEHTQGTLAERLLKSLIAGEKAGGQISGKRSAALLVKGTNNEWYNQVDLRVDNSLDPFNDLQRLLNYHYGLMLVNQAIFAINDGNKALGEVRLTQAVKQTEGWYGMYSKIAKAYIMLGQEQKAIGVIKSAITAEPKWKENLSAFYCLYADPTISALYPVSQFTVIDWNNAISMLIDLKRYQESISLSQTVLRRYPSSSYTWYLLAKAYTQSGNMQEALAANEKALNFDPENADAKRLKTKN